MNYTQLSEVIKSTATNMNALLLELALVIEQMGEENKKLKEQNENLNKLINSSDN